MKKKRINRSQLQKDLYALLQAEMERTEKRSKRSSKKKTPSKRSIGSSRTKEVKRPTHFRGKRTTTIKQTTFKRAYFINAATSESTLIALVEEPAKRHFKKLGKAERNIFYLRLFYTFQADTRTRIESNFSIGTYICNSQSDFLDYIEFTCSSFLSMLDTYKKDGLKRFALKGVEVRSWRKK